MEKLLSREEFEFLLEEVISTGALKPPRKELAMLEAIYQAGKEGADVTRIADYIKEYHEKKGQRFLTFQGAEYTEIKKDLDKLKQNINRKLKRYYSSKGYSPPFNMVLIGTISIKRKVRYILRIVFRTFSLTFPSLVASNDLNSDLIHTEWASIIKAKPLRFDYMGTVFDKGLGNTSFRNMMLDNIESHSESMYRILMLHPESELLKRKIKIYEAKNPVKTDLIKRIRSCEDRYKEIKKILPLEHKDRIQIKYCRSTPFVWSRFLIILGKEVHFRVTQPDTREKFKLFFSSKSIMYRFAVDAFEIMWSDDFSEPAPEF